MTMMQNLLMRLGIKRPVSGLTLPGEDTVGSSERGTRSTPDRSIERLYQQMWVDPRLRAAIVQIREMDKADSRVKKIHTRMARTAIKGGLILTGSPSDTIRQRFADFVRRLHLGRPAKLESDARGLAMEGNLPIQWVLDAGPRVVGAIRMPSETLVPNVGENGRFIDITKAYNQLDINSGKIIHAFPLWQLTLERLSPDNFDDHGCMGRPYLDASRSVWRKLMMSDEDLVIRRRTRAPLRLSHVLEGASPEDLEDYQKKQQENESEITGNYYSNKKTAITAIQGDTNLDQIADLEYLLDTFYAGSPAPKGLFGYSGDLARDILEDLKRDYYEEIDALQDAQASVYQIGFELDLLLAGINPENENFKVQFAERRTETINQATDRGLKLQAMGVPKSMVWETAGIDVEEARKRKEKDAKDLDPYPEGDDSVRPGQRVSITPGNRRKSESGTAVSN